MTWVMGHLQSTLAKDSKILLTKVANFHAFMLSTSSAYQLPVNKASSTRFATPCSKIK